MLKKHGLGPQRSIGMSILAAGMAGGLAEVVWVGFYSLFTPLSGVTVAREITASVFPALASLPSAPWLGVAIHFIFSLLLAACFVFILARSSRQTRGVAGIYVSALMMLALVWVGNFFIVLPAINPVFIGLMPYTVTLISKLLFGVAMATAVIRVPGDSHPVWQRRLLHHEQ